MTEFDKAKLKEIKKALSALPKLERAKTFNAAQALEYLKKDILRLAKKGYEHKEIAAHVSDAGLSITPGKIKKILNASAEPAESAEQQPESGPPENQDAQPQNKPTRKPRRKENDNE